MLDRVTLRTKFIALIVVALLAIATVSVPSIVDHARQRDAADRSRNRVRIAANLGVFLDRLGGEATLTAWFGASGEPTVRAELAGARPLTDRSARALASPRSERSVPPAIRLALRAVSAQWSALRTARARFDRRLASDDQVLVQFDRSTTRVAEALDVVAREPSGLTSTRAHDDPARALSARALLAELQRDAAASQAGVMTAVVRHEVSPSLARRLRSIADREAAAPATMARWARSAVPGSDEALREYRPLARTTTAYRAPALVGRLPFVTAAAWRRVSGLEIDAIEQLGHAADQAGVTSATQAAEHAGATLIRTALLLAVAVSILILTAWLFWRKLRQALATVTVTEAAASNLAGPAEEPAAEATNLTDALDARPEPSAPQPHAPTPPVAVIPPLPRRTREQTSPEPGIPLSVPARRAPDAVFELVARYEAGLRRARAAPDPVPASEDAPR